MCGSKIAAGQRVGYVRVSTLGQNTSRQLDGVPLDRTFTDNASCRDQQRPQLEAMLGFVRTGDTVVVHSNARVLGLPGERDPRFQGS